MSLALRFNHHDGPGATLDDHVVIAEVATGGITLSLTSKDPIGVDLHTVTMFGSIQLDMDQKEAQYIAGALIAAAGDWIKYAPVTKVEYRIISSYHGETMENLQARLSALGAEGWEPFKWETHEEPTGRPPSQVLPATRQVTWIYLRRDVKLAAR